MLFAWHTSCSGRIQIQDLDLEYKIWQEHYAENGEKVALFVKKNLEDT